MTDQLASLRDALADRYAIETELGAGGMATVYLAEDLRHHRKVAVKVLRPELAAALGRDRFVREIEIAAGLTHPHIVPVFDSGQAGAFLFYVQPFIDGETLGSRIARERMLPLPDVTQILLDVAGALGKAHGAGIVHRDIKPDNIMLSDRHALVTDFGVAKAVRAAQGAGLTTAGTSLGTPLYMAPEQAAGDPEVDHRADIYALGATGYEMVCGTPPFTGENLQQIIAAHVRDVPKPIHTLRDDVPSELEHALMRCLEKRPEARWLSTEAFTAALGGVASARAPSGRSTVSPTPRRRRWLAAALGVALAAVAGYLAFGRSSDRVAPNPDVIAVAPFDVIGPELDFWSEAFAELLSHHLDGSGRLRTVSPTVSFARWTGRADPAASATFARNLDAGLALYGRIVADGADGVRITATLLDASDQSMIRDVEVRGPATALPDLADSVAAVFLTDLSRLRSLGAAQLNSLGSGSPAAIREFLLGERHYRSFRMDSAALHYHRTLATDSSFALAWGRLGMIAAWEGNNQARADSFRLAAGALNRGLSVRESLLVAADSMAAGLSRLSSLDPAWRPLMRRYFDTMDKTSEWYPNDAQVLYRVGEGQMHRGWARGVTELAALESFDQAARLDTAFALAYPHLMYLRYAFVGANAGNAAARAYLALHPTGPTAVGAAATVRLFDELADGDRGMLESATAFELLGPVGMLGRSVDSLEAGVLAAIALMRRDPTQRFLAAQMLAYRGHLRDARDALIDTRERTGLMLLAEIEYLMGESRPLAAHSERPVLADVHPLLALTMAAERGDTTAISQLMGRSGLPTNRARATERAEFVVERAQAFLALARGDTVGALRLFDRIEPHGCPIGCAFQQLIHGRLLAWAERHREAARRLESFPNLLFGPAFPGEIVWHLERARARERIGDHDGARAEYSRVVDAWGNGDDTVQPVVAAARDALERMVRESAQ